MHVSFWRASNRSSGHCIFQSSLPTQAAIHFMDSLHRVFYRSTNNSCCLRHQIFNRCRLARLHTEGENLTVPSLYAYRLILHGRRCLNHYRDVQIQANSLLRYAL